MSFKVAPIASIVQYPFGECCVRNPSRPSPLSFHQWESICFECSIILKADITVNCKTLPRDGSNAHRMQTRTEKSIVICSGSDKAEIYRNAIQLEELNNKYYGAILFKDGSSTATVDKLDLIWCSKTFVLVPLMCERRQL